MTAAWAKADEETKELEEGESKKKAHMAAVAKAIKDTIAGKGIMNGRKNISLKKPNKTAIAGEAAGGRSLG